MLSKSADLFHEACRSLFLGDLSCFCQEIDIYRVFSQFGVIEEIRIKRNNDGNGLGYGFVTFLEMNAAENALAAHGLMILGRSVKVSWANVRCSGSTNLSMPAPKPKMKELTADTVDSAQLHFSFISKHQRLLVTEETIRKVFMNFGHVQDVTIKKTSTNPKTGEQTGYGFVHFPLTDAGIYSAISAVKLICNVFVGNVLYDCRLAWSLEEIIRRKQFGYILPQLSPIDNFRSNHDEPLSFHHHKLTGNSAPLSSPPVVQLPSLKRFRQETPSCPFVRASYPEYNEYNHSLLSNNSNADHLTCSSIDSHQMSGFGANLNSFMPSKGRQSMRRYCHSYSHSRSMDETNENTDDSDLNLSNGRISLSGRRQFQLDTYSQLKPF